MKQSFDSNYNSAWGLVAMNCIIIIYSIILIILSVRNFHELGVSMGSAIALFLAWFSLSLIFIISNKSLYVDNFGNDILLALCRNYSDQIDGLS